MMTNAVQYVLQDKISIEDYPVEKTPNYLSLNLGYGGVYRDGNFSDLEYFSGPYAGLSFPFGNRVFSGSFWSNTSLSFGVFLRDFSSDSLTVTGPIVKRPFYAALGYRVFDYLKLHAGAVALEEDSRRNADGSRVYAKPFVGLSLELNLWLGSKK